MTLRMLLVDDEPHILRLMRLKFEAEGFEIDTAPNGEAALKKILASPPDVLITDIQMPRMTGEQLCHEIAARLPEQPFLIVLLTSRTEVEHRIWSADFNNLWFFEKPVSMRKLIASLNGYQQAQPADRSGDGYDSAL
ncbi:MAG: response regulator transcription factor [Pontibacterium sp.]